MRDIDGYEVSGERKRRFLMGKKKREHIVFDGMHKVKKRIPISMVNRNVGKKIKVVRVNGTNKSK